MQNHPQITIPTNAVALQQQSQPDQAQANPTRPTDEDMPVEFHAEMRTHAVEPITGADVELGYEFEGEWQPLRFGEGPSLHSDHPQLESWLRRPETEGLDLEFSGQCVAETIERCLLAAKEIVDGKRPVPQHAVWVWPVNDVVWQVNPGERIPPGISHILRVGQCNWSEAARI